MVGSAAGFKGVGSGFSRIQTVSVNQLYRLKKTNKQTNAELKMESNVYLTDLVEAALR